MWVIREEGATNRFRCSVPFPRFPSTLLLHDSSTADFIMIRGAVLQPGVVPVLVEAAGPVCRVMLAQELLEPARERCWNSFSRAGGGTHCRYFPAALLETPGRVFAGGGTGIMACGEERHVEVR